MVAVKVAKSSVKSNGKSLSYSERHKWGPKVACTVILEVTKSYISRRQSRVGTRKVVVKGINQVPKSQVKSHLMSESYVK